eukprot:3165756-Alexandrium_andersonii.AAC.1
MSASLVGSEMCIRDRGSTNATASGLADARTTDQKPGSEEHVRACVCACCLLYTSDDADDM